MLVTVGLPLGFGRHFWDIRALNLTPFRLHVSSQILRKINRQPFIDLYLIRTSISTNYLFFKIVHPSFVQATFFDMHYIEDSDPHRMRTCHGYYYSSIRCCNRALPQM